MTTIALKRFGFAAFLSLFLVSCASLNPFSHIDTAEDYLTEAKGVYAFALQESADLYDRGLISDDFWIDELVPKRQNASKAITAGEEAIALFGEKGERAIDLAQTAIDIAEEFLKLAEDIKDG